MTIRTISLCLLLAGCSITPVKTDPVAEAEKLIDGELGHENILRMPLKSYARSLDRTLKVRNDDDLRQAVHTVAMAEACMGVLPQGHAENEVRRKVVHVLTDEPERHRRYERFLEFASVAPTEIADTMVCQRI